MLDKTGLVYGFGRVDQGAIGVRINVSDEPDIIKFPGKVDATSG